MILIETNNTHTLQQIQHITQNKYHHNTRISTSKLCPYWIHTTLYVDLFSCYLFSFVFNKIKYSQRIQMHTQLHPSYMYLIIYTLHFLNTEFLQMFSSLVLICVNTHFKTIFLHFVFFVPYCLVWNPKAIFNHHDAVYIYARWWCPIQIINGKKISQSTLKKCEAK